MVKPKHQSEDVYVVVGFVVARVKRITSIQVILMPNNIDGDIGISCLTIEAFLRICEDAHRVAPATEESCRTSLVARHIAGLTSMGAQPVMAMSEVESFGKSLKAARRKRSSAKIQATLVNVRNLLDVCSTPEYLCARACD